MLFAAPSAALGRSAAPAGRGPGVTAAQVIPDPIVGDHPAWRIWRIPRGARRDLRPRARARPNTCKHWPRPGSPCGPDRGSDPRPGQGVMRQRPTERGCPARGTPWWPRRRGRAVRASVRVRPPAAATTARGSGSSATADEAARGPPAAQEAGVACWPRSWSRSPVRCRSWWSRSPSGQAAANPVGGAPTEQHLPRGGGSWRPTSTLTGRAAPSSSRCDRRGARRHRDPRGRAVRDPDGRVLVNELAMRPHNTGHWTQDGAVTSQFENHLRAVLDLPLGPGAARAVDGDGQHPRRPQTDQVGRLYDGYPHALARDPRLRVHLYGKDCGRPQGRPRQRLRRRPRGLPGAGTARRRLVPRRPRKRE